MRLLKFTLGNLDYWIAPEHVAYVKGFANQSDIGLVGGQTIRVDGDGAAVMNRLLKDVA